MNDASRWLTCLCFVVACSGNDGSGSSGVPAPADPSSQGGASGSGLVGSGAGPASGGSSGAAAGGSSGVAAGGGHSSHDAAAAGSAGAGANTAVDGGSSGGTSMGAGGSGVAGSGGTVSSDASVTARGTGPGDWGPGDYPPALMAPEYLEISGVPGQNGLVRQYKVHVPPSYDPNEPTPLVFCIHGLAQDPLLFCLNGAAMHTKSDAEGFILVMPNGYLNSWNGGTCCGAASTDQLDDVALFRAIFDEVGRHLNVDLDRVYATGLSNGAYMSYRLACEAADIFAAVAPGAGAVGKNDIGGGTNPFSDFTECRPSRPVSILATHGTADLLVSYSLMDPSLAHMAAQNGCATTTAPAAAPVSAGDTTCVSHGGCPAGIEVTGCTVQGGGHCWFGSADCGTGAGPIGLVFVGADSNTMKNTDAVWDFFRRHPRSP